jgi:signal transduction histidine kinase
MLKKNYKILTINLIAILFASLLNLSTFANTNPEKEVQQTNSKIDSLNLLSFNHRRSNPKLSLEIAIKTNQLCKEINYPRGLAFSIHNMGTAKAVLGRFDRGLADLIEASRIREEIGDYEGLIFSLNNIGFIYSKLGNDKKALEFYQKALSYQEKENTKQNIGILLNNIGNVYYRNKNYEKALEYYQRALALNEETKDERGYGTTLSNIGLVYQARGNHVKGLEYHLKAFDLVKKHNDKLGLASTLRNIAEVYLLLKQDAEATNFGLRSLLLTQELGSLGEEKSSAELLARIYEKRNKYKESNFYLKLESRLKDSLFSIQRSEVLGRMESAFEMESQAKENEFLKKEQAIYSQKIRMQNYVLALLAVIIIIAVIIVFYNSRISKKEKKTNLELIQKNNEIQKQKQTILEKVDALDEKNTELQEINQIKNKLISVIAHDLKNPFNNISGYSEIIANQFSSFTETEIISFIRVIQDNSMKGNMLLDNLLQWSRLQTRTIQYLPVNHNLNKLISDELFFIHHVAKQKDITVRINIHNDIVVFADSNMLKTVVRNLLSNALKFTKQYGEITICAEELTSVVKISVADNGEGIEPHIKERLFTGEAGVSTASESGEKGTGLGLMLCKDFINRHNGEIWVESKPGEGATFFITLPHRPFEDHDEV